MRGIFSSLLIISLMCTTVLAGPNYIDSRGNTIQLAPAPDKIAVAPVKGLLVEQSLALHPELNMSENVVKLGCGLWEISLTADYRGRGEEVARALLAEGLVARLGAVFAVPGSPRRFLLDRGVMLRLEKSIPGLPVDLLARTGLQPVRRLDDLGTLFLCRSTDAHTALAGARAAARLPGVAWALPDFIVPIDLYHTPNDSYYSEQWYHYQASGADINTEEAWDVTTGDSQVIVAVVDTGLEESHPDFASTNIVTGYDLPGNDNDPTPPADAINAHGTCCSGEIAASMDNNEGMAGTCPGCSLMGIRMMDGWASVSELSNGYLAIQYATNNGAWVLSNSWGISQDLTSQIDMQPFYTAVQDAVNNGRGGLGSVVLFASGNDGVALGIDELANMPGVMAVGGTDNTDQRVSYSNYGSNLSVVAPTGGSGSGDLQILTTDTLGNRGFSRNGEFWEPWFPGSDYNTNMPEPDNTGNYTRYFNGTSAACPIAAGVVALTFSANPSLTGAEARFVVEHTADKVGGVSYDSNGHNNYYGYGRVNAGRAVRAAEIGFNNPDGSQCAEDFNCTDNDCQKQNASDFYGNCGGLDCSSLPDGSPCDDGNACTINDQCSGGSCTGSAKNCSDGNVCTDDSCNPTNGNCTHVNNTAGCNDGNACTLADQCSGGTCTGSAKDCSDGNVCTNDSCNPSNGNCTHNNNTATCDDGDACTINDSCSGGLCAGSAKDCSDANVCTDDSCNPSNGNCTHSNNNAACDDGDLCTTDDSCSAGSCSGTAIDCDDSNACTDDSCDIANGCINTPNNAACDDADACTTNDHCSTGSCTGSAIDCNDTNLCTDDSCDSASGCINTPNAAACDDGNFCTTNDHCSAGACSGSAVDCDDANTCTDDSCDIASGCINVPNNAACDDGDACTANDSCSAGACSGAAIDCDDANACTDDSCNPATGCAHTNNQAACDDDDPCTMSDSCADGSCAGTSKDCSSFDGPCQQGICNTAGGQCRAQPLADGTVCEDGDQCTAEDTCQAGACVAGENICTSSGGCGCSASGSGSAPLAFMILFGFMLAIRRGRG
ncbi:MAG TPA: S8 family serine peptidase [Myxococcota bacterium]|nr:S8 family serine peptidase [Myxococcota bacterium]